MGMLSPQPPATSMATYPPQANQRFLKFNPLKSSSFLSLRSRIHLHRPCPPPRGNPTARLRLCHAALSPQPPPQSDPTPGKDPVRARGAAASFSRFKDRVQVFFAVLFWMSLFFWASVWDGRNNSRGRLNKGSRFRR